MNDNYCIVKFVSNDVELDVNVSPSEETIWLSQKEMAILFKVDISRISRHIRNAIDEGEINEKRNLRKTQVANSDKLVYLYNLDVVISVGYRVKSQNGVVFRKWANSILKQYLLKGYVINDKRVVVSNENYIELKNEVVSINNRLSNLENKLNSYEVPSEKILYNCEFYDAYSLLEQIFESSDKEIILMDNYIDRTILDRLTSKKKNVKVTIYTSFNKSRITQNDINAFNIQYPTVTLIETQNLHDRYIIIDSTKLYHVGASIKDAGKKIFSIHELDSSLITILLSKL